MPLERMVEDVVTVTGIEIRLMARNVRKEKTGIHARVGIGYAKRILAWDNFNVEREAERTRLASAALQRLVEGYDPPVLVNKEQLKYELSMWCLTLWDKVNTPLEATWEEGNKERGRLGYILKPYVLKGGGTILFGPPGLGKSYTALTMAVCINNGLNHLFETERTNVLFLNLERSADSVKWRLGNVNEALGLPRDEQLLIMNARGRGLNEVMEAAYKSVSRHVVGCVVLDSISRTGLGKLNEDITATSAIDSLSSLCQTWIALGHSPRHSDEHVMGSVQFDAGADITVQQLAEAADNKVGTMLSVIKGNDIKKPPKMFLAFEFDEKTGLTGIRLSSPREFPELASKEEMPAGDEIEQYLLDVGKGDATEISEELGLNRRTVANILSKDPRYIRVGKEGRKILYAVRAEERK